MTKSTLKNYRFNEYDLNTLEFLKSEKPEFKESDIVRAALRFYAQKLSEEKNKLERSVN